MRLVALPYRHHTAPRAPLPGAARPMNGLLFSSFAIRKPVLFGVIRTKPRTTAADAAAAGPDGSGGGGAPLPALDLTEDNIRQVLTDARVELEQLFDESVGITGEVELSEVDGPFVKISLKGRFWHKRSTVLARVANYLKLRIPEILEVDIEDEKQLDDSPENF